MWTGGQQWWIVVDKGREGGTYGDKKEGIGFSVQLVRHANFRDELAILGWVAWNVQWANEFFNS